MLLNFETFHASLLTILMSFVGEMLKMVASIKSAYWSICSSQFGNVFGIVLSMNATNCYCGVLLAIISRLENVYQSFGVTHIMFVNFSPSHLIPSFTFSKTAPLLRQFGLEAAGI